MDNMNSHTLLNGQVGSCGRFESCSRAVRNFVLIVKDLWMRDLDHKA